MKAILACMGLTVAVCALVGAQDNSGARVVVPGHNSTRPRVVKCNLVNGSITVKTGSGQDVIVEEAAPVRASSRSSNGMHRIGVSLRGLEVVDEDNTITIRKTPSGHDDLIITVPVDTSLRLHNTTGKISVDGVHGEVEVHATNGPITLTNVSGTVTADSNNGPIKVTMDRVDSGKPLSFSSLNGAIDVTFPADFKSNLTVKTNHAAVYSDFDVLLGGARVITEKNGSSDGRYRIRMDDAVRGTINGGGVDLTIRSFNGGVYIRKKK